jgi:hypothetical protein
MKRLILLVLVAGAAWLVYRAFFTSPKGLACSRLADLCEVEAARCEQDISRAISTRGAKLEQRLEECAESADSCQDAMRCAVEAGYRGFGASLTAGNGQ